MNESKEVKKPKTWDEAFNELQAFILKSKKEEAQKAEALKVQSSNASEV